MSKKKVNKVNSVRKPNGINLKVYVAKSKIKSGQKGVSVGLGLFVNQDIIKKDVICYYGGDILDREDAKYKDPSYLVEFQKGHTVLSGHSYYGDLGIFANSVHPLSEFPKQNATFVVSKRKSYDKVTGQEIREGRPNDRGIFPIIARRNMVKDEEVIVNYKTSYWATIAKYKKNPPLVRSESAIQRQLRAERRQLVKQN